MESSTVSSNNL